MEEKNELIRVSQLPVIYDTLEQAKIFIDKRTSTALEGECNEDNYKQIKALRAALNKEKKELDARYKKVMGEVTAPLIEVQTKYKECVSGYVKADEVLKGRICTVETAIKNRKEKGIREYFAELTEAEGIDFLSFEDTAVKVSMSASEKSLKKAVSDFVERVKCDISMINTQEQADEILVEYKKSLSASAAIMTVQKRRQAVETERRHREAERERIEQEQLRRFEMEQEAEKAAEHQEEAIITDVYEQSGPAEAAEQPLHTPEIVKTKPSNEDEVIVLRLDLGRVRTTKSKARKLKAHILEWMEQEGGYERL